MTDKQSPPSSDTKEAPLPQPNAADVKAEPQIKTPTLDAVALEKQLNAAKAVLSALKEFPVATLWSLILMVGGILMFSFFASIEFMPEIDMKAALSLIAATAMIGIIVVVVMGGILVLPAIAIKISRDDQNRQAILFQHLIEAALGVMLVSVLLFWAFDAHSKEPPQFESQLAWALLFLGMIVGTALHRVFRFYWINGIHVFSKEEFGTKFAEIGLRLLLWGFWAGILGVISIFLLREANAISIFSTVVVLPLAVAMLSLVTADFTPKARLVAIPILAILGFLLQGTITQQFSWVAHSTMRFLGQSFPHKKTQLIVMETGCATINAQIETSNKNEPLTKFVPATCTFDEKTKRGLVPIVRIVSRVGSHYVLDFDTQQNTVSTDPTKRRTALRIVVPSNEVTSWSHEVVVTDNKM